MSGGKLLEICCGSVDDAIKAQNSGADRIELNSALFLGGLTPSYGSVYEARRLLNIPLLIMIRPRSGGFCYSESEIAVMERDIATYLEMGADGVVFGCLNENGSIDIRKCKRLLRVVGNKEAVFHKAFDVTLNPFEAHEELMELGFTRILTSGQEQKAIDGAKILSKLVARSDNRIEILPGGGIKPSNVKELIEITGCKQVHMGGFKKAMDNSATRKGQLHFGSTVVSENSYEVVDPPLIRKMKKILEGL